MPRVAHVAGRVWAVSRDGTLRHADTADTASWQDAPALPSAVVALASCDDREVVFAACRDGSLHLFHAHTAALILSSPSPLHDVPLCLLPLSMENALFVGLQDGAVVRMHLASLAFDCMLGCGVEHSAAVNALDADAQYLYSGGEDAVILVWDLKEATAVREISMPSAPIHSLLRVDVALWVGLANGAVEVFDIFGDDTNGIERISDKAPHMGPVTDLIKIGETEVWSLSAAPDHEDMVLDNAPSVAVWDTRDLTFSISESDRARDVMSVAVVDRIPFEEVTILALTNSLGPYYISKNVKGSLAAAREDESELFGAYSDLGDQFVQGNNEDLQIIRQSPGYGKARGGDQEDDPLPTSFVISPPDALPFSRYPFDDGINNADEYSHIQPHGAYGNFPAITERHAASCSLSRSVSEALLMSLCRLSELLVTLLTDDVLSPSEGHTRGSNDELRAAVATITRELNVGTQLVESCIAGNNSDNSVVTVDENDITRNVQAQNPTCCDSSTAQVRKRLETELDNNRILRKDLNVVTKERDLLAEDLHQVKAQSETTMSSLEGIIRDNDTRVASKDALVLDMRKECKMMEAKYQDECERREQMEKMLEEQIEALTEAAQSASRNAEAQVSAVYDKMETKSIEIQSQRDSIRALEKQLEGLKSTNQSLDGKCKTLEHKLTTSLEEMQEATREYTADSAEVEQQHQDEVSRLREEHGKVLALLQKKYDNALSLNQSLRVEMERGSIDKDASVAKLREELQLAKSALDTANARQESAQEDIRNMSANMQSESRRELERSEQKISELEERLETSKMQADIEVKICKEKCLSQIQEKLARIEDLEMELTDLQLRNESDSKTSEELQAEVVRLRDERCEFQQELEHRKAAADLSEIETEKIRSAVSNYKTAAEKLQKALDVAEGEIAALKGERRKMMETSRKSHIGGSEEESERNDRDTVSELTGTGDNRLAMQALLASANGEIEQMSNQLEAMHRVHTEQEKELSELRAALLSPEKITYFASQLQTAAADGDPENTGEISVLDESQRTSPHIDPAPKPFLYVNEEVIVSDALQEVQEDMAMTQDKLRELSKTARKYKKSAQCHLEVLPALYELEAELVRICQEDTRKAGRLSSARGIVQSVIALYFSSSEKRAALGDYNQSVYFPSSRRLDALQQAVAQMRAIRIDSREAAERTGLISSATDRSDKCHMERNVDEVPTPRRLLTF